MEIACQCQESDEGDRIERGRRGGGEGRRDLELEGRGLVFPAPSLSLSLISEADAAIHVNGRPS